jgi:hypothetical protein
MIKIVADIPIKIKDKVIGSVHLQGDKSKAGSCRLFCMYKEKPFYSEGADYFEALQQLRKHFERKNIELLCLGARKDVWPSAMSRDMGKGLKAYVCRLGEPSSELVNIFDHDKQMKYSSVEEQVQYHKQWFESLGT